MLSMHAPLAVSHPSTRIAGAAAAAALLRPADDLALCLVALMASHKHVRNTYLRSKLSECLDMWLPQEDDNPLAGSG